MAAWERYLGGAALPHNSLRDVIERSWQRCLSSHVDPGLHKAPFVFAVKAGYLVLIPFMIGGLGLQILLHLWRLRGNQ